VHENAQRPTTFFVTVWPVKHLHLNGTK
jgi:hypothetical protein